MEMDFSYLHQTMGPLRQKNKPFRIAGEAIDWGETKTINLQAGRLFEHTELNIPVRVVRGQSEGPVLFISAAIHGDEIIGVEIIRRLMTKRALLRKMKGTLMVVPIVNVFGFIQQSRYLPDRRDLNRSFPGSKTGPLASRIAHLFMKEIVNQSTHGIDLHSGGIHRSNYPQIRACLDQRETKKLAISFGAPLVLNANIRDGSLRQAALKRGIPMLLFEGGEALRFNQNAIQIGLNGILSVMSKIGMLKDFVHEKKEKRPIISFSSYWSRAPKSGILKTSVKLGDRILRGEALGTVADPFGDARGYLYAEESGVMIGMTRIPLVNRGDAVFHIAKTT